MILERRLGGSRCHAADRKYARPIREIIYRLCGSRKKSLILISEGTSLSWSRFRWPNAWLEQGRIHSQQHIWILFRSVSTLLALGYTIDLYRRGCIQGPCICITSSLCEHNFLVVNCADLAIGGKAFHIATHRKTVRVLKVEYWRKIFFDDAFKFMPLRVVEVKIKDYLSDSCYRAFCQD